MSLLSRTKALNNLRFAEDEISVAMTKINSDRVEFEGIESEMVKKIVDSYCLLDQAIEKIDDVVKQLEDEDE